MLQCAAMDAEHAGLAVAKRQGHHAPGEAVQIAALQHIALAVAGNLPDIALCFPPMPEPCLTLAFGFSLKIDGLVHPSGIPLHVRGACAGHAAEMRRDADSHVPEGRCAPLQQPDILLLISRVGNMLP